MSVSIGNRKENGILSHPVIKTEYNERCRESERYLEVSGWLDEKHLGKLVNGVGSHFESALAYVRKKKPSRAVFISAESQEAGLMAVAYIAACLDREKAEEEPEEAEALWEIPFIDETIELPFETEDFEGGDEPSWDDYESCDEELPFGIYETANINGGTDLIPIVCAAEVASFYSSYSVNTDMNQRLHITDNCKGTARPWWAEFTTEPICIMFDEFTDRNQLKNIARFSSNKRVYVVFTQNSRDVLIDSEVNLLPFGRDSADLNRMNNAAILENCMDEVSVFLNREKRRDYHKAIVEQCLVEHGRLILRKQIPYGKIIEAAEGISSGSVCTAINSLINYAYREDENDLKKRVKASDFEFLNKFEERKSTGEKSAEKRLEKEIFGLYEVKKQIRRTIDVMKLNKLRSEMGLNGERYHNVHVMLGAPGTAKTTVAKLMGEMMMDENLLPGNRCIIVNGAQLKGEFVGQSAPKTRRIFERNDIIVIDEAYSMVDTNGRTDSFSNEAIAQLIIELESHSTDKLVIFAGYGGKDVSEKDNKMQLFLDSNPGIQSRINSTFYFPSYSSDEMADVFRRVAERNRYTVASAALPYVREYFESRVDEADFGNGREARNLLETCTIHMAERIMKLDRAAVSKHDLESITVDDVMYAIQTLKTSFGVKKPEMTAKRIGFIECA